VGLVGQNAGCGRVGVVLPGPLEFVAVALGVVALEEFPVAADAGFDEVFRGLLENRPPLFAVGRKQRLAAPAVERRSKLPAEIDDVIEPVIEAVSAVRRMRMRGVAGDKDAAGLIGLGDRNAQIPEASNSQANGKPAERWSRS
jgi:hypothetical protein